MDVIPLGERLLNILRNRKTIKDVFIRDIREESQTTGVPIEKLLVERKVVSEIEMALAVAEYLKLPPILLTHFTPNADLLKKFPRELLVNRKMLPMAQVGKLLILATADPFDVTGLEQMEALTQCRVIPLVATESDMADALQRHLQPQSADLESVIGQVAESDVEVAKEEQVELSLEEALEKAHGAPVIRVVNSIMLEALRKHASDVHLDPMEKSIRVRYRIDGILYDQPSPPKTMQAAITSRIKLMSNLNIAEHRTPQDGRFKLRALGKECDVRVSMLPTVHGEKIVMRILDKSALTPNLAALGLDRISYERLSYAVRQPHGMILVTGPTGSGKTTTLYSALQELNKPTVNVVTIEDPVEYQLPGVNQVQTHPEVGLTFAVGLRAVLRQAPNIVMVGEIRDDETASIAVTAALTGHMVLSTLHTNDAAGAIARMLYMGIDAYMLSSCLVMAQAQRLYRRLCPACKKPYEIPPEILRLNRIASDRFQGLTTYRAVGCPKCARTGYKGRGALMEILLVDSEIRELILQQVSTAEIREKAIVRGMRTLRDAGLQLVQEGVTSLEEVLMVTSGE